MYGTLEVTEVFDRLTLLIVAEDLLALVQAKIRANVVTAVLSAF